MPFGILHILHSLTLISLQNLHCVHVLLFSLRRKYTSKKLTCKNTSRINSKLRLHKRVNSHNAEVFLLTHTIKMFYITSVYVEC